MCARPNNLSSNSGEHLDEIKLTPHTQLIHYRDDILVQGSNEEEVQQVLELVVDHRKQKDWEINPTKIQVKFLGIQWQCEHQEIFPKAQQKILEFAVPQNKKEAARFIGLFIFWRQHILHLRQISTPLHKVTRGNRELEWGSEQQAAFELAKEAISQKGL